MLFIIFLLANDIVLLLVELFFVVVRLLSGFRGMLAADADGAVDDRAGTSQDTEARAGDIHAKT